MNRSAALTLALSALASCSSNPTTAPDAGTPDASVDVPEPDTGMEASSNTPYEQAVLSAQWQRLTAAPTVSGGAKQDDVFFLDAMHGWLASGPNFALYQTSDGGNTWTQSFMHQGTYFRGVVMLDAMHGFAGNLGAGLEAPVNDTNVLYGTSDGMTWAAVTTITGPMASGICNLTAIDATHLVAVGRANGPANLLSSSDGGQTWTSVNLASTFSMIIDARFTTPTDGIVAGMDTNGYANVAHTSDGGQTFTTVFTSKTANSLVWKISFPSSTVGYIAIQDATQGPPTFGKTMDGGMTWVELPLPVKTGTNGAYPAIGVGFITENVGWMSPDDPTLPTYVTSDGGNTWSIDPTLKSPINRFRFVDMNTAYAVGASVWKLSIVYP
jgi:photosystem II stability/assembly factor-like uncharacterized protein